MTYFELSRETVETLSRPVSGHAVTCFWLRLFSIQALKYISGILADKHLNLLHCKKIS
jgi:hypothetical protein